MKFYKISRFNQYITENKHYDWQNIDDVSKADYPEYLNIEQEFIHFLKSFYDFFCQQNIKNFGYTTLAYAIILNVDNINHRYENIEHDIARLKVLHKINLEYMNDDDVYFIFQCWLRNLCNLYLFDISSNSFLKPMDGDFYFYLALADTYELNEIFTYSKNIYIYVDLDHNNYADDYIPPSNLGESVYWT